MMADSVFSIYFISIVTIEKLVPKSRGWNSNWWGRSRGGSTGLTLTRGIKPGLYQYFEIQSICCGGIGVDTGVFGIRLFPTRLNSFHVLPRSAAVHELSVVGKNRGCKRMWRRSCCSVLTPFSRYETQLTELFFHTRDTVWGRSPVTSVTPGLSWGGGLYSRIGQAPLHSFLDCEQKCIHKNTIKMDNNGTQCLSVTRWD